MVRGFGKLEGEPTNLPTPQVVINECSLIVLIKLDTYLEDYLDKRK